MSGQIAAFNPQAWLDLQRASEKIVTNVSFDANVLLEDIEHAWNDDLVRKLGELATGQVPAFLVDMAAQGVQAISRFTAPSFTSALGYCTAYVGQQFYDEETADNCWKMTFDDVTNYPDDVRYIANVNLPPGINFDRPEAAPN